MLIWEVIRNIEKDFTVDFDTAYGNGTRFKNVEKYRGIIQRFKDKKHDRQIDIWRLDSKDY